jgi:hypothetical protein
LRTFHASALGHRLAQSTGTYGWACASAPSLGAWISIKSSISKPLARQVPVTEDPIADLFAMALMTRRVARENPHLYDLMFGLSTRRATYRPLSDSDVRSSGRSPAFRAAYVYLAEACARLVSSGRVGRQEPEAVAAQLWSYVHGCITLELAEHFAEFDDPVAQVLLPMGVNLVVGLGDDRERAQASHEAGARLYDSITRGSEGQAGVE